ncbi:hypothetical protein DFH09DRAFT_916313 [Mycena vulgaris]|nr:hypothetical protein DFH09DRAFT_916313 [Mycena vulgaris]
MAVQSNFRIPYILFRDVELHPDDKRLRGFLYYHVPYPRLFLSGGIRFRCCRNLSLQSFAHGQDLLNRHGLRWDISLPRLMTNAHDVFFRLLL